MRASRLLSVLLLLQNRGRMTAQELADELEVSVRTVYRDVEALSAAGVPVYADRGPAGGYQLVDGYRTRLTGMTSDEADSLLFTGMPGPAAELGLGTVLAAAQLKLMAALPPELRDRAGRIQERFHLDAPGWFRDGERVPHLAAVADAVWNEQVIRVRYQRWGQDVVERELRPLGLCLKAGTWYLVACATDSDEPRTYRAARIQRCEPCEQRFTRPAGFDLAGFWRSRDEHLRSRLWRGEAVIRLSAHGRRMVFLLGPVVRRAVTDAGGEPDADGWLTVTVPIETFAHAVGDFLKLGADLEVVEPAELRTRIAATATAVAALYR